MTEATYPEHMREEIQTRPVKTILALMASTAISMSMISTDPSLWIQVPAFLFSVMFLVDGIKGARQMFYSWGWI